MRLSDFSSGRAALACGLVQPVAVATRSGRDLSRSTPSFHCVLSLLPRGRTPSLKSYGLTVPAAFASLGQARPPRLSHEATSGFAARYGPQFRSHGFAAHGFLAPPLLEASRLHAGSFATCFVRLFYRVNSFHFTRKAPLSRRTQERQERQDQIFLGFRINPRQSAGLLLA
jgi:hypothetical protein